jgi:hypothetical protein
MNDRLLQRVRSVRRAMAAQPDLGPAPPREDVDYRSITEVQPLTRADTPNAISSQES